MFKHYFKNILSCIDKYYLLGLDCFEVSRMCKI